MFCLCWLTLFSFFLFSHSFSHALLFSPLSPLSPLPLLSPLSLSPLSSLSQNLSLSPSLPFSKKFQKKQTKNKIECCKGYIQTGETCQSCVKEKCKNCTGDDACSYCRSCCPHLPVSSFFLFLSFSFFLSLSLSLSLFPSLFLLLYRR